MTESYRKPVSRRKKVAGKSRGLPALQRRAVLVVGMHRSGTSALTRVLSLLGCTLPATLVPATDGNPTGHWESNEVMTLNQELLTTVGSDWDDWLPLNQRIAESPRYPEFVEKGRALLRQEYGDAALLIIKDPRMCRLVPFWFEVLKHEDIEPTIVIPLRNPVEVARSLAQRDRTEEGLARSLSKGDLMEEGLGLLLWLRNVLDAEAGSRGHLRVFVNYEDLLIDWELVTTKISEATGIGWPLLSPLSAMEIDGFIAPDLRHHVSPKSTLSRQGAISPWIAEVYAILLRWTHEGERVEDHASLDAISKTFGDATTAFARPMLAARGLRSELIKRSGECDSALAERDAIVNEQDAVIAASNSVIIERDDLAAELDGLAAERDGIAANRDAIITERDTLQAGRDALVAHCETLRAERDSILAERDAIVNDHDAVIAASNGVTAERDDLAAERDSIAANRDAIIIARDTLQADRNALAAHCETLGMEHEALSKAHGALADDHRRLSADHLSLVKEDHELREQLQSEKERASINWNQLCDREAEANLARANKSLLERKLAAAIEQSGALELELRNELHINESTLRQRDEENHQLRQEFNELRAEHAADIAAQLENIAALEATSRENAELVVVARTAEAARFKEIAQLTRVMQRREVEAKELRGTLAQLQHAREVDQRMMNDLEKVQDQLSNRFAAAEAQHDAAIAAVQQASIAAAQEAALQIDRNLARIGLQSSEIASLIQSLQRRVEAVNYSSKLAAQLQEAQRVDRHLLNDLEKAHDELSVRLAATEAGHAAAIVAAQQAAVDTENDRAEISRQLSEIESLTQGLQTAQAAVIANGAQAERFRQVSVEMANFPRWWALVPRRIAQGWEAERLKLRGLFDLD